MTPDPSLQILREMQRTMNELGLIGSDVTIQTVQRRLNVDTPAAMRLLSLREGLLAVLAALDAPQGGWREIATVPKDNSDFLLLWCSDVSETGIVGYWSGRRWEFAHCDSVPFLPTHWIPLPEPPQ